MPRPSAALAALLLFALTPAPAAAEPVYQHLRLIAPAAPGGGWDQTARVMQQALQSAGIVHTSSVENIPGAAGTIGLARFVSAERGTGDVAMVSGLIMLGAIVTHRSALTLHDVTPIARLLGEYEVIVVPAASPFRTLADLIRAFKERPESISWGGGSAGGTEQILAGLVADAVGVDPRRVNYIAFSGGGESLSAILGGQVSVGINGLAGVRAATSRPAPCARSAISSADAPPRPRRADAARAGVDVELENWRSLVAPPGVSTADRQRLEGAVEAMVQSAPLARGARALSLDRSVPRPATRSRASSTARKRACSPSCRSSAPAATTHRPAPASGAGCYRAGWRSSAWWSPTGLVRGRASGRGGIRRAHQRIHRRLEGDRAHRRRHRRSISLLVERGGLRDRVHGALLADRARLRSAPSGARRASSRVGVSVGAYLLFARVLQLPLPAGVLAGWM